MKSKSSSLRFVLVRCYWGMTYLLGAGFLFWSGAFLNQCQAVLYLVLTFGLWQWCGWGRTFNLIVLYGLALASVFGVVALPLVASVVLLGFTGQQMPTGMIIAFVVIDVLVGLMAFVSARILRQYEPA